ncbi:hypothetical protein ALQ72_03231 [Pseudomonas syringae pv. maculicola]|nr:hypothetical protein ALQ72_03231 [Pseudomonas syringae pv. maculicola]
MEVSGSGMTGFLEFLLYSVKLFMPLVVATNGFLNA